MSELARKCRTACVRTTLEVLLGILLVIFAFWVASLILELTHFIGIAVPPGVKYVTTASPGVCGAAALLQQAWRCTAGDAFSLPASARYGRPSAGAGSALRRERLRGLVRPGRDYEAAGARDDRRLGGRQRRDSCDAPNDEL